MLREAQKTFREGRHPECQWRSGQRGLGWVFASRELGRKAPYRLRRDNVFWCFLGSCLRTESLETFLLLVSWPQGKFTLLNSPKILEWRKGCGLTHFEKYGKVKHPQDHTQMHTVPLSPHTNAVPKKNCFLPCGASSITQKLQWGFTCIGFFPHLINRYKRQVFMGSRHSRRISRSKYRFL